MTVTEAEFADKTDITGAIAFAIVGAVIVIIGIKYEVFATVMFGVGIIGIAAIYAYKKMI